MGEHKKFTYKFHIFPSTSTWPSILLFSCTSVKCLLTMVEAMSEMETDCKELIIQSGSKQI